MRLLTRLFGRGGPAGFSGELAADERILASAVTDDGGPVVATSHGLWLRGSDPAVGSVRRTGWHEINKATWQTGVLTVVVAERIEVVGCVDARSAGAPLGVDARSAGAPLGVDARSAGAPLGVEIIADGRPRRLRLPDPGKVPQTVQARVEGSIRTRARRILPGGGTWVVHRRVVGQDGVLLQVRPDPGTDPAAVRRLAAEVAAEL